MLLIQFAEGYALRADLSEGARRHLLVVVRQVSQILDREAQTSDLDAHGINTVLAAIRHLAPQTRAVRRRLLLALADDALRMGHLTSLERAQVARVKVRPKLPEGLTWEEARAVLEAVKRRGGPQERWLRFTYRKLGVSRRAWWGAFLQCAWDTGAPADLRALLWAEIKPGGRVAKLRGKTGKVLRWQLSDSALASLEPLRVIGSDLVFPLPGHLNVFRRDAKHIFEVIAGRPGVSLGHFRSGAGSDAELLHGRGAGAQLLGNTPAIFARHYDIGLDRTVPAPRPLEEARNGNSCASAST